MKRILILALLVSSLAACSKPDLPDPTIAYPDPPAELMTPLEQPKPLPQR